MAIRFPGQLIPGVSTTSKLITYIVGKKTTHVAGVKKKLTVNIKLTYGGSLGPNPVIVTFFPL